MVESVENTHGRMGVNVRYRFVDVDVERRAHVGSAFVVVLKTGKRSRLRRQIGLEMTMNRSAEIRRDVRVVRLRMTVKASAVRIGGGPRWKYVGGDGRLRGLTKQESLQLGLTGLGIDVDAMEGDWCKKKDVKNCRVQP